VKVHIFTVCNFWDAPPLRPSQFRSQTISQTILYDTNCNLLVALRNAQLYRLVLPYCPCATGCSLSAALPAPPPPQFQVCSLSVAGLGSSLISMINECESTTIFHSRRLPPPPPCCSCEGGIHSLPNSIPSKLQRIGGGEGEGGPVANPIKSTL
jgi:hypothetical protein